MSWSPFRRLARALPVVALILLLPQRAAAQRSALERGVDSTVSPGDDFFGYANGAWLSAHPIPAGMTRWGAREEIAAKTRAQVDSLLAAAWSAAQGTAARKVADFRNAYLDQGGIDSRGVAAIEPLLDSIDRISDRKALTRFLGRELRADVDPLNWAIYNSSQVLGLSVEPGINGESTYVAFLVQGGLGLPDRDNYLSNDTAVVALRAVYTRYVARMLALSGADHPEERARDVLALETAMAETHATAAASALDHNADTKWSRADFASKAPGMDWDLFFAAAGLGRQESFVPWQPAAVTGVATLVAARPLSEWRSYLRFHALDHYADVLPRDFAGQMTAMRAAAGTALTGDTSRARRALDATQLALGEALGRMYSERYFSEHQKRRVQGVVDRVVAAFARRLERAAWMSLATRTKALAKVRSLYVGIGYPEHAADYSDLQVDPRDAYGNVRRAELRTYRHAVSELGRRVDRSDWWILPQTSGGVLIFQQNAYDFTAALLQPPKYDSTASDAAAYGAIGAIIGHDVSHYVDLLGAEYDIDGREHRWWTDGDAARWDTLTRPLVDQFSAYHPLSGVAVDGAHSRTENAADLAGLVSAFDAYRASLGVRGSDSAWVRMQDREFFLAYAAGWRVNAGEAYLRQQAPSDHAPERYRVNTVRNIDAWYAAFDVRPGQQLYLPESQRVRVW